MLNTYHDAMEKLRKAFSKVWARIKKGIRKAARFLAKWYRSARPKKLSRKQKKRAVKLAEATAFTTGTFRAIYFPSKVAEEIADREIWRTEPGHMEHVPQKGKRPAKVATGTPEIWQEKLDTYKRDLETKTREYEIQRLENILRVTKNSRSRKKLETRLKGLRDSSQIKNI